MHSWKWQELYRANLVAMYNTNYNIFLRKRKDVVKITSSVDKPNLGTANAFVQVDL